jgi:hypothetical protein
LEEFKETAFISFASCHIDRAYKLGVDAQGKYIVKAAPFFVKKFDNASDAVEFYKQITTKGYKSTHHDSNH